MKRNYQVKVQCKSEGLQTLAAVTAIAVPISAPLIAGSIASSQVLGAAITAGAQTWAGGIASSAIVGAAQGAIAAKIGGYDASDGAQYGAFSGALGGAFNTAGATGTGAHTPELGESLSATTPSGAPVVGPVAPAAVPAAPGPIQSVGNATSGAWGKVPAGLRSGIADGSKTLAGQYIGQKIFGGETKEQERNRKRLEAEAADTKRREGELFGLQLNTAQELLANARRYDPAHGGRTSAAAHNIDFDRKEDAYRRSAALTGRGYSAADRRRGALDRSRGATGAYTSGYDSTLRNQTTAFGTASNAIPKSAPSGYADRLTSLREQSNTLQDQQRGAGNLGSKLAGYFDPSEEEDEV